MSRFSRLIRAAPWIGFHKRYRGLLDGMVHPLLADPLERGWTALQAWDPDRAEGALLAFRQGSGQSSRRIALKAVPPGRTFELRTAPSGRLAGIATSEQLRSGVTEDGKTKLKSPSGTLSTAEAISVVNNVMALAGYYGDGTLNTAFDGRVRVVGTATEATAHPDPPPADPPPPPLDPGALCREYLAAWESQDPDRIAALHSEQTSCTLHFGEEPGPAVIEKASASQTRPLSARRTVETIGFAKTMNAPTRLSSGNA